MGALPKQRMSRHRQGNRRRHIFLKSPELVPCQTCRELHRAHHVCPNCGYYGGRQAIELKPAGDEAAS